MRIDAPLSLVPSLRLVSLKYTWPRARHFIQDVRLFLDGEVFFLP